MSGKQTAPSPSALYSPALLGSLPLHALIAFSARCAHRVQPLWGAVSPAERRQLVRAIEVSESVGSGASSTLEARQAKGVEVARWSANRPDFAASRTARGAAIYALSCACLERSAEAAMAALLTVREVHFAAGGDASDLAEAEARLALAWTPAAGSVLHGVAMEVKHDLERLLEQSRSDRWTDETPVSPEFFGPLWRSGPPDGWPC